jgi:hypothetical protein
MFFLICLVFWSLFLFFSFLLTIVPKKILSVFSYQAFYLFIRVLLGSPASQLSPGIDYLTPLSSKVPNEFTYEALTEPDPNLYEAPLTQPSSYETPVANTREYQVPVSNYEAPLTHANENCNPVMKMSDENGPAIPPRRNTPALLRSMQPFDALKSLNYVL